MYLNEFTVAKFVSFDSEKSSLTVQGFRSDFTFNLLCHSVRVDKKFFDNCSAGDLLFLNIRNSYNVKSKTWSDKKVSYPLVVGVEKWDPTFADNINSVCSFLGVSHDA